MPVATPNELLAVVVHSLPVVFLLGSPLLAVAIAVAAFLDVKTRLVAPYARPTEP